MTTIEIFADAVMRFEGWREGSMSWRNRNPGNLRSSKLAVGVVDGYAVFDTLSIGWLALLQDIQAKCKGAPHTRTSLGPNSTIQEFFHVWAPRQDSNHPVEYAKFVAGELSQHSGKWFTPDSLLKDVYAE